MLQYKTVVMFFCVLQVCTRFFLIGGLDSTTVAVGLGHDNGGILEQGEERSEKNPKFPLVG